MIDPPPERKTAYESFVLFMSGWGGSVLFLAGFVGLVLAMSLGHVDSILGIRISRLLLIWFFGFIALQVISGFVGWDKIVERKRLAGKLKPIPARGKKIEIYEIESGEVLGYLTEAELKYLIDAYVAMGMEDNDFYIMTENLDMFELQGADPAFVGKLRAMMGERADMEVGWTRV